jgi:hypothetical protein
MAWAVAAMTLPQAIGSAALLNGVGTASGVVYPRDNWPTHEWEVALPEKHAIDTNSLANSLQQLPSSCPEVHGLLLVRHGRLIVERYFHGKKEEDSLNIKSASKSIIGGLVGIALEEGSIRSLDQPVISFFPEYREELRDSRKDLITIRHLLSMTAGLEWIENGPISRRWMDSRDRIGFTLRSKLVANPGTEWNYSTALTHLLSALLTRATGTNTQAFARRALLDPIGIPINQWDQDLQGYYWGGSEVYLTPRSMAKFGYLYLNNGLWDGKQIVPRSWVSASTQQTNSSHYGFLWWLDTFDGRPIYFAQGLGGQHIVVVPHLDAVIVTTSYIGRHNSALGFIKLMILPCIQEVQETPSQLPQTERILERYYKAIGGPEQLSRLKSLRMAGKVDVESMGIQGKFELLKGSRNRIHSTVRWPKGPLERFASDGKILWTSYPNGFRRLRGEEAKVWLNETRAWADLRGPLDQMKTIACVSFDGRPCYQVRCTTRTGEVLTHYFEIETGLLAGSICPEEWYHGLQVVTRVFREYRAFGKFQWPTKVIRHVQGPEAVFVRDVIEYNDVHPAAFDLPIPIKDILKGRRTDAR